MTPSQSASQSEAEMVEEIGRTLRDRIDAERPRPRPVAAPPPASSAAPPAPEMWGLHNMPARQISTPLQLLAEVAEHAIQLHQQMEALVTEITGEQPAQKRIRTVPQKGSGLLPAISQLAHEIDAGHAELARLIAHVRRQCGG